MKPVLTRRQLVLLLAGGATSQPALAFPEGGLWPFIRRTAREPLLIAGSGTMHELNQALAGAFAKRNPLVDVVVERGGSMSAFIALRRGSVDVAAMSRDLREADDQREIRNYLVARNGVAVVVHPSLPLRSLSSDQLRRAFDGSVRQWSALGGPPQALELVTRKRGTPARQFLEEMVLGGGEVASGVLELEKPKDVVHWVESHPAAMGFILLKDLPSKAQVRVIEVDGVAATRETILSGRYPLTQSLYFVVSGSQQSLAQRFVDFVRSPAGQAIVDAQNLVGTY